MSLSKIVSQSNLQVVRLRFLFVARRNLQTTAMSQRSARYRSYSTAVQGRLSLSLLG